MAGVHGGGQSPLRNINRKAKFEPCSNHILNLCGVHASAVNANAITFFGVIERLYTFLFSFIYWWGVLSSHVKVMLKNLITTHWSARYETIRAVKTRFQGMIQALESITWASENLQAGEDARIILLSIENFSFMSHLFYWDEILGDINLI